MTDAERAVTVDALEWAASCLRYDNLNGAICYLQDAAEGLGFTLRPINDATAQARLAEIYDGMNTL